jgi:hypothetical protein
MRGAPDGYDFLGLVGALCIEKAVHELLVAIGPGFEQ